VLKPDGNRLSAVALYVFGELARWFRRKFSRLAAGVGASASSNDARSSARAHSAESEREPL